MAGSLSSFERWALRLALPGLGLPALLETASDEALWQRAFDCAYLIWGRDESTLAHICSEFGGLDYLEAL